MLKLCLRPYVNNLLNCSELNSIDSGTIGSDRTIQFQFNKI